MLDVLFGSKLRARVLGWLFTHPDERYFIRQLSASLKEDSTNVGRELARLEKLGIVISSQQGRQKYYQANRHCAVFSELQGLAIKTTGVANILRDALAPRKKDITIAFIYGSMASGEITAISDVDVMVIGDISFGDTVNIFSDAEEILAREISVVVYGVDEFKQKLEEGHHFVQTVMESQKIFLIGNKDELGKLAE